jgi:hypothetical protein
MGPRLPKIDVSSDPDISNAMLHETLQVFALMGVVQTKV